MTKIHLLAGTNVGDQLTPAGGTGDDAWSSNTMAGAGLAAATIVAVSGAYSGRGVRINAASADRIQLYDPFTSGKVARFCDGITPNAIPASSIECWYLVEATSYNQMLVVRPTPSGTDGTKIEIFSSTANAIVKTMATIIPSGTRYNVAVTAVAAASPSATNGTVSVALYLGNSQTPAETWTGTSVNLGGGAGFIRWQRFKMATGVALDMTFDSMQDDIGSDATMLTPYTGPALTVAASLSGSSQPATDRGKERTLTLAASGGNGKAMTWGPIDWGDGLTADAAVTTAAGVASQTFKRTPTVTNDRAKGGTGKTLSWTASQAQ